MTSLVQTNCLGSAAGSDIFNNVSINIRSLVAERFAEVVLLKDAEYGNVFWWLSMVFGSIRREIGARLLVYQDGYLPRICAV